MLCDDRKLLNKLQAGPLAQWAAIALAELSQSAGRAAPLEDCSLQIALVRLLRLLAASLPKSLSPHTGTLVPTVGALLVRALSAHEAKLAEGGEGCGAPPCDSEGGLLGCEALSTGLFDLLAALGSSSKLYKALQVPRLLASDPTSFHNSSDHHPTTIRPPLARHPSRAPVCVQPEPTR